jgi:hypothetical protein
VCGQLGFLTRIAGIDVFSNLVSQFRRVMPIESLPYHGQALTDAKVSQAIMVVVQHIVVEPRREHHTLTNVASFLFDTTMQKTAFHRVHLCQFFQLCAFIIVTFDPGCSHLAQFKEFKYRPCGRVFLLRRASLMDCGHRELHWRADGPSERAGHGIALRNGGCVIHEDGRVEEAFLLIECITSATVLSRSPGC